MSVRSSRLDSIQALRGIAAVLVMLLHLSKLVIPGAFGVDIFFIISGFIMVYSTRTSEAGFAVKRAIRIIPLYFFATFVQLLLYWLVYLFNHSAYYKSLLSFQWLMQSLFFVRSVDPILQSGWTLNLEVAFYCVFGIAAFISQKHRAILCAVFLILFVDQALFLEFIMGMGAFYILKYLEEKVTITTLTKTLCTVFCLMLMLYFFYSSKNEAFNTSNLRAYKWGIPALLFVISFCIATQRLRLPRWLTYTGDISYSIYLWHIPIQFVVVILFDYCGLYDSSLIGSYQYSFPKSGVIYLMIAASGLTSAILTIALSRISYTYIELKLTAYLRKKFIPTKDTHE
jgi:peptidoglycan/LPS O-acetylase OafA/YrhL